MPVLLFRLRGVPDDESSEVRELLSDNGIDFYETSAGGWGISMPAIWLHDEAQLSRAKSLIDAYQQDRKRKATEAYDQLCRKGEQPTVMDMVKEAPLKAIVFLAAVLLVLYISLMPFLTAFR